MKEFMLLWEAYLPRIVAMIHRYGFHLEQEDALQEAGLVLWEAMVDYDASRGVPFGGYFFARLRFHLMDKSRNVPHHLSLDQPTGEGEMRFVDTLMAEEDIEKTVVESERKQLLYDALARLSPRQRELLCLVDLQGRSMVSVAKELGLSYRSVINTRRRALKNMSMALAQIGLERR